MKKLGLILRIISYITTAPALGFFFYFVLLALGDESTPFSFSKLIISILVLIIPVVLNLLSRVIDGTLFDR